jgi:hypothetical protein
MCNLAVEITGGHCMYFKDEESLKEIDELIEETDRILRTDHVLLLGGSTTSLVVGRAIGGSIGEDIMYGGMGALHDDVLKRLKALESISIESGRPSFFKWLKQIITKIFFKKKRERELLQKKIARLQKVVAKQNELYERQKTEKEKLTREFDRTKEENEKLKDKLREYELLFEALLKKQEELMSDLNQI